MSFEKVQEALKGTELEHKLIQLDQSSATVELAAKALHTEPDRIAKTLSFFVGGQPILIVVAGEARIDNKKYKGYFHEKARMIPFDEVEKILVMCREVSAPLRCRVLYRYIWMYR